MPTLSQALEAAYHEKLAEEKGAREGPALELENYKAHVIGETRQFQESRIFRELCDYVQMFDPMTTQIALGIAFRFGMRTQRIFTNEP